MPRKLTAGAQKRPAAKDLAAKDMAAKSSAQKATRAKVPVALAHASASAPSSHTHTGMSHSHYSHLSLTDLTGNIVAAAKANQDPTPVATTNVATPPTPDDGQGGEVAMLRGKFDLFACIS